MCDFRYLRVIVKTNSEDGHSIGSVFMLPLTQYLSRLLVLYTKLILYSIGDDRFVLPLKSKFIAKKSFKHCPLESGNKQLHIFISDNVKNIILLNLPT